MTSPLATPMPWNLVAPAYADEIRPVFEHYAREALRLAAPPAGARVIDVACGPGTLSALAAGQGLQVDALDFSPEMIAQLEARKLASVTPRVGDGQALPYADGTFAAGFSMFGLMFFPDRARGFAELRRVLAPGARAVISSWLPLETVPAMAAMFPALREAMYQVLGNDAPKPGERDMPLIHEAVCEEEMSRSFAEVTVHRVEQVQRFETSLAWWQSVERTMAPLVLLRKGVGEDRWKRLSDAAYRGIAKAMGEGPLEVTMPAWLTVGTAR